MTAEHQILSVDLEGAVPIADMPIEMLCYQLPTIFRRLLAEYFKEGPYLIPALNEIRHISSEAPLSRTQVQKHLIIERVTTYRGDAQDQGPAILIREDSVAMIPHGMAEGLRQVASVKNSLGQGRVSEKMWVGTIVLFAMSSSPDESRLLAIEVAQLFAHFGEAIRKELKNCKKLRVNQIGASGKVKEFPKFFGTPVVIDYAYTDNTAVFAKRLPIRDIVLNISS